MGYRVVKISQNTPRCIRNKLYKLLMGTTITISGRRYRSTGLVRRVDGRVLSPGVYMVPSEKLVEFIAKLREKNLDNYIDILKVCLCTCDS